MTPPTRASIFDDPALDDRAKPIIAAAHARPPAMQALRDAVMIEDEPSPAMLENTARWIEIRDALAAAGLTPHEVLRVLLRARHRAYGQRGPTPCLLDDAFTRAGDPDLAVALCEDLLARNAPDSELAVLGPIALDLVIAAGRYHRRFAPLYVWYMVPWRARSATLGGLPVADRESLVLAAAAVPEANAILAVARLDALLAVRELVDTPAVAARRAALIAAAADHPTLPALVAEEASGAPRRAPVRPTKQAKAAIAYWIEKRAAEVRTAGIGAIAEAAWDTRAITVDAPELASMAAWAAATDDRRRAIALAVTAALGAGWKLARIREYGGSPIAVLTHRKQTFSLVPGGTVDVGLSAAEEALIRAAAAARAGIPNFTEEYGHLLAHMDDLRPVRTVTIGPLVAAQETPRPIDPARATAALERSPLRLPSEAEWEHLARGGRTGEPTFHGPELPDAATWFTRTRADGARGANAVGLWGFGYQPEVCADAFAPGHAALPADGAPVRGAGPRVVKGGAAALYPWQACGEWQLLLSAMRSPQTTWEYGVALRFVIGVVGSRR
jgi:hypothetical protein